MLWLMLAVQSIGLALDVPEPKLITVEVNRVMPAAPDVAVIGVGVSSAAPIGLDDAVALVKPAGFTEADFTDGGSLAFRVFAVSPSQPTFVFQKRVPAAQGRELLRRLTALSPPSGTSLESFAGSDFSDALKAQARQRLLPEAVSEARRQAQAFAAVSGLRVKELAAVRDGGVGTVSIARWFSPVDVLGADIIPVTAFLVFLKRGATPPQASFSFDFLVE